MLNIIIVVVYFVLLLAIGMWSSKKVQSSDDAVTAGKSLSLFASTCGKAATTLSGTATVGSSAYGYSMGITGVWFNISTVLLNICFMPIAGRCKRIADRFNFTTLGDFLQYRYGLAGKTIAGVMNMITYVGFEVSQIIATGAIISTLLGIDLTVATIGSTVIIIIYTLMGGMHAIIYTDIMQLFIIYLGIVFLAFPIGLNNMGGFDAFWSSLPATMTDIGAMGALSIVVMILSNALGTFTLQAGYLFSISAKDPKIAAKSSVWGGVLYVIPAIFCTIIGIMAFTLNPSVDPNNALGEFMTTVLPDGISGLLMAAVIAATMSSSSGFAMCGAQCFVTDVYKTFINPKASDKQELTVLRIALGVVIIVALIISMFFSNIVSIILWAMQFSCGALLVPTLACFYWRRATKPAAVVSMLVGGTLHLVCSIVSVGVPAFVISVPTSFILMVGISLLTKPQEDEVLDAWFGAANGK